MTGLLVAQEIDWAKMALSDPITKYLTQLPASFNEMTPARFSDILIRLTI